jgi:hypothetical protein
VGIGRLLRAILRTGHWGQCKFCRRYLPTRAWTQDPRFMGGRGQEAVEASGYCTYCDSRIPKETR